MKPVVGPNGRLYQRAPHTGRWIAATIIAVAVVGAAIIGLPLIASGFSMIGL